MKMCEEASSQYFSMFSRKLNTFTKTFKDHLQVEPTTVIATFNIAVMD